MPDDGEGAIEFLEAPDDGVGIIVGFEAGRGSQHRIASERVGEHLGGLPRAREGAVPDFRRFKRFALVEKVRHDPNLLPAAVTQRSGGIFFRVDRVGVTN